MAATLHWPTPTRTNPNQPEPTRGGSWAEARSSGHRPVGYRGVVDLLPDDLAIRAATAADAGFLTAMLGEAMAWRPGDRAPSAAELLTQPELAHYVTGWPRTSDLGVVADTEGPVGAAWSRCFTVEDPGYGFVAPDVPELSIAVAKGWRGLGVGRLLLVELIDCARSAGHDRLSLSVEPDNPAVHLYRSFGFEPVGGSGGAATLVRPL